MLGDSDVPYGKNLASFPTAAAARAACTARPDCAAYTSTGRLKQHAGCEWGSDWCIYPHGFTEYPAARGVELYVKTGASPPAAWQAAIAVGTMLYSQPEPDVCMMPDVGNGFVASVVGFGAMHVSGLFTGASCTESCCQGAVKAHLPSVTALSVTNSIANATQAALDLQRGMYVRRLRVPSSAVAGSVPSIVEQRTYAHRTRRHIMMTEFELIEGAAVELELETLYDPLCGPPAPAPAPAPELVWNGTYLKVSQDSGPNNNDVGNLPACESGGCPALELRAACDKNPACEMFQTHGFLKSCPVNVSTTPTKACWRRTPWLKVDAYYKVHKPDAVGPTASATTDAYIAAVTGTPVAPRGGFGEGQPCSAVGQGCAGGWSNNVAFEKLASPSGAAWSDVTVFRGNTSATDPSGSADSVIIASRTVPATLKLGPGTIERFGSAITTTLAQDPGYDPVAHATEEYAAAVAPANATGLLQEHTAAWAAIWAEGTVDVRGVADDATGRALDIQSHLHSSMYYLITSIREDWPHGALNPGGLASDNYDTVFFDMEFYMEPALLWWWPALAKTMTQFRFEGLAAAKSQAKIFGYEGAQFPWCTVSFGRSSGCCNGQGGQELCLEQHITPDVGFAMQQFFRWTGDKAWLAEIGYPIVKSVAEWIVSRVRLDTNGAYHIDKVMPVDEWCDQSSGCGSPGVNDDPQMNGASKAALQFAVEAAAAVGAAAEVDPRWSEIAAKLVIPYGNFSTPFGSYHDVHLMPTGTVPFGTYMSDGHGTVCPEDVMYLTYPMGPALNISVDVTARDLDAWVGSGLTCLENGGMTHPIHIVSFLLAQQHNASYRGLAERSLNGTMYGVCYGPFNLRNEIDRHNSTVGGHGSNTHFITGDGGFINAFVSGYGGLMLGASQGGLQLSRPTVPERTSGLAFRGLKYLGGNLDYEVGEGSIGFRVHSGPPLCLLEASGKRHSLAVGSETTFATAGFGFPATLGPC